jgi:hypothetical protein
MFLELCSIWCIYFNIIGVVRLSVPFFLAVETLSARLRVSLGIPRRRIDFLAILIEINLLLRLALFFETSDLVDHHHLVILLDSTSAVLSIHKSSDSVFFMHCML